MLYLDTSVLVAAFTPEENTTRIQQWLADQDPNELHVSDWGVTEYSSALSIKLRSTQISRDQRARALAVFTTLLEQSIAVLHVSRDDFRTAAHFADQTEIGLRAGDALHLAVAGAHGATLYTLDRKLLEAGPAVAVDARSP